MQAAFDTVCKKAKVPEKWYVILMETCQAYGGPEEGGWYRTIREVVAYQEFQSEDAANAAKEEVQVLAEELSKEKRDEHGKMCLSQMEWLDARGLDADWLPENDGPSEYYVTVSNHIPENNDGSTHYE